MKKTWSEAQWERQFVVLGDERERRQSVSGRCPKCGLPGHEQGDMFCPQEA